ncbi:MAG: acyltransferase family protein [Cyclobacteriaceae bacterium]
MSTLPSKNGRIHALDSLRAIMMLLGIVIHSALTYGTIDYGVAWMLKDPFTTHISNDFIVDFIHSFRMQIFFLVAGFFGAMLFYDRSPAQMIKNRLSRILYPFLAFLFLLWPTIKFAFTYTALIFDNVPNALSQAWAAFFSWTSLLPNNTFHLWFLYYLIIVTMFTIGFAFLFIKLKNVASVISRLFGWIIVRPLVRLLFFSLVTALVYMTIGTWSVATSASFIPNFLTIIYYFSFYLVGWVLFKSKNLLDQIKKADWVSTILGSGLFSFHFIFNDSFTYYEHIIIKSIMVWLLIFGITGLFIRYASKHSPMMRYISDASYWVYLVHLTCTALVPGLIVDWAIPSVLKFLVVLLLTGILCFTSYHYLVRDTFIGMFLNGRRYPKK